MMIELQNNISKNYIGNIVDNMAVVNEIKNIFIYIILYYLI